MYRVTCALGCSERLALAEVCTSESAETAVGLTRRVMVGRRVKKQHARQAFEYGATFRLWTEPSRRRTKTAARSDRLDANDARQKRYSGRGLLKHGDVRNHL
jgi:hypothetical protein